MLRPTLFALALLAGASAGAQTPCVSGTAGAYGCQGVDLLAHLPLSTFASPGSGAPSAGNDIWGWTDPATGREYALVGTTNGTAFVDVTSPATPVFLGKLPTATGESSWRDIKVYQNHAVVVSEAPGHGMQVFDLTRLRAVASPPVTFAADAVYTGFGKAHNVVVNEATGFAYGVGSVVNTSAGLPAACTPKGFHAVNIQNPLQPTFAGCFSDASAETGPRSPGYTHDAQCVLYAGPDTDYTGREICIASNEDVLTVFDATDKAAVRIVSQGNYPGFSYTHQAWFTPDQRYALLNDELDERNGLTPSQRTLVMDLQDLDDPELAFQYVSGLSTIDHNLYTRGQHAYESNYESGLRILDLSGIGNGSLSEVAFFDTYPQGTSMQFNGNWSNYPYFASGTVVASDINNGLFVLRPDLLRTDVATVAGAAGWRLLAAPAAGVTVDDLAALNLVQGIPGYYPPPQAGPNLYTGYDGTAYAAPAGGSTVLASGRGFFWYFYDQDVAPGGPSNSTALPSTLVSAKAAVATDTPVTLHASGDKANMLGNPFGTSLDVSDVSTWPGASNLNSFVVQMWNPSVGTSGTYESSVTRPTVSPWQGFFAEAATAGTLTIPASARTTGGTLVRPAAALATEALVAFELASGDPGSGAGAGSALRDHAAVLVLGAGRDAGHDMGDAAKLAPPSAAHVLLAFASDGGPRAVESRPLEAATVALSVASVGAGSDLVLTWPRVEGLPPGWSAVLRDVVTGQTVDLAEASRYAFSVTPVAARSAGVSLTGAEASSGPVRFELLVGPRRSTASGETPVEVLALEAPRPNPARGTVALSYMLAESGASRLAVVDLLGREVAVVASGEQAAGSHTETFDTGRLAPGVYMVRLSAGREARTQRLVVVR